MLMMLAPGVAQGATIAELQAQIAALLAQVQTLQAQLTALGGGTAAAACTFTRNLYPGVSGDDVKCLQQYLNSAGNQVAASGPGSVGNETTYYGTLTTAAVSAWQAANGVVCGAYCGYFGPLSQAKYDVVGGVTVPTCNDDGTCDAGETNASCPADCPATTCGNGTCDAGESNATCPADCPVTACVGTEGSYTVTLSSEPVTRTVNAGVGLEAYGLDITASDSDINIGRLDLQAAVANAVTGTTENPGNFILAIKVYKGSVSDANLLKTVTSPVFAQDTTGLWHTLISGFSLKVAVGITEKLLVVIDTGTTIDQNRTVTVNVYGNGLRGADCLGISTFMPMATTRVLTVQQPGVATVTISGAADNPNSDTIQADANNGVQTKETLLSLNAKATAGPAALIRLEIGYASAGSTMVLPSILYLYDGDTLVSSATPNATENGRATFENFVLPLAENVIKNLKVKANWAAAATFSSGGASATIMALASTAGNIAGGVIQRANGQQVGVVIAANITSNPIFIAESGLGLTFISGTASFTPQGTEAGVGTATGTIVFKAQPFGGTLLEPAYASDATGLLVAADALETRIRATFDASVIDIYTSAGHYVVSRTLSASPANQNIVEGTEVTVTTNMSVALPIGPGALAGNVRFNLSDVCYTVGTTTACIGSGSGLGRLSGGVTGNLVDNWFTNWVNLAPQYFLFLVKNQPSTQFGCSVLVIRK